QGYSVYKLLQKHVQLLRACPEITVHPCISSLGHLWPALNRQILTVALLRLRFDSISPTESDPNLSAILLHLFPDRPLPFSLNTCAAKKAAAPAVGAAAKHQSIFTGTLFFSTNLPPLTSRSA